MGGVTDWTTCADLTIPFPLIKMATAGGGSSVLKLPFMDIQCNWDEVVRYASTSFPPCLCTAVIFMWVRSSRGKRVWVSCRQPGDKTENSDLAKGDNGTLQGEEGGRFAVIRQNSVSVRLASNVVFSAINCSATSHQYNNYCSQ